MIAEEFLKRYVRDQQDAHVLDWLQWRAARFGTAYIYTAPDGTRVYLDPEDVYTSAGELEP